MNRKVIAALFGASYLLIMAYMSQMVEVVPLHFVDAPQHILRVEYIHHGIPIIARHTLVKPPLWFFFNNAVYTLVQPLLTATYVSIFLAYAIGFTFIFLWARSERLSFIEMTPILTNPIAVVWFLIFGRYPEMMGWIMFLPVIPLALRYGRREVDRWSLLLIPALALAFTHYLGILFSMYLLPTVVWRRPKLIPHIFLAGLILIGYLYVTDAYVADVYMDNPSASMKLLIQDHGYLNQKVMSFLIPLAFLSTVLIVDKKDLITLAPSYLVALLLFSRILCLIPYLNRMKAFTYNIYFLMLLTYIIVKHAKYTHTMTVISIGLVLLGGMYASRYSFELTEEDLRYLNNLDQPHPHNIHWMWQINKGIKENQCRPYWSILWQEAHLVDGRWNCR
jgi:hypothetical protein